MRDGEQRQSVDSIEISDRISTGVDGFDEVLDGGLVHDRTYMIRGDPGTGKSILGLSFLLAGVDEGESVLYVNLEESAANIRQNAASLGMDAAGVEFLDLSPDSEYFTSERSYDVFEPDVIEGESVAAQIRDRIESLDPARVFVDPLTQLRYLAADDYQFRKRVLSLMRFLNAGGATVLFTAQATRDAPDDDLQFLSDGTFRLAEREKGRTLRVEKFRGSDFGRGEHTFTIGRGGITLYPVLRASTATPEFEFSAVSSGVPKLDELLHGGLERGTVSIITGATGVGKTTTGTQFMKEAAGRGERSVVFLFEETEHTLRERSNAINIPVDKMLEQDALALHEIEAWQHSVDEFNHMVRQEVEERGANIVMIDGIKGYRLALRGADERAIQNMHTLCRYLKNRGVTVILVNEVHDVTGDFAVSEEGLSYLADNILFLRHLEIGGEMRKAIGVLKKRTSDYERTLREFRITEYGVKIGEPLRGLRDVLTGHPEWPDRAEPPVVDNE